MSKKEFRPEGPSPEPAPAFVFAEFGMGGPARPAFRGEWPEGGARTYSPHLEVHLREMKDQILKQAKEEALLMEKEAYEKGFAQGERDGLELSEKRLETIHKNLQRLLADLDGKRQEIEAETQATLLQLTLSIAKKILHHDLDRQKDVILFTLKEAFRQVIDPRRVIVHLHPSDHQFLRKSEEGAGLLPKESEGVKIIEDASLTRGGCRLETNFGRIDATIEHQFDEIVSLVWRKAMKPGRATKRKAS